MKKVVITVLVILAIVFYGLVSFEAIKIYNSDTENKADNIEEKQEEIENVEDVNEEYNLSMFMVGDAIAYSSMMREASQNGSYNFDYLLDNFKNILPNYDLVYYNQESILGGDELELSSYPRFNSPYEFGDAFVKAGFNLVSLANNHSLDAGEEAIINSVNYWGKQTDVVVNGTHIEEEKTKIYEKNNIKYAFLSYTTSTNGLTTNKDYLVDIYDAEKVKEDIESVRDDVDVVIVAMHWGVEYTYEPTEEQKQIATYLSSLGVDIIIGSHPHCIEPIEYINNTLVIYSLGNFIAAQRVEESETGKLTTGLAVSLNIKKKINNNETSIEIENVAIDLTYIDYTDYYTNYAVYPYGMLNNNILSNYEERRTYFENIALNGNTDIKTRFMDKYLN